MKKILTTMVVLTFVCLNIGAQKTFYVYRNDGQVNTFFFDMVDSITISYIDIDSIIQPTHVVQEIWTQDSIYRIPLSVIDSIGFQTPSNILTEDSHLISQQLREYVIGSDSMKIYLAKDTPSGTIPKVGSKLVTLEMDSKFPYGFLGRVKEISQHQDNIVLHCEQLELSDAFDRYYIAFRSSVVDENQAATKLRHAGDNYFDKDIDLGSVSINYHNGISLPFLLGTEIDGGIDLTGTLSFPGTRVVGSLIFEKEMGTYFSMTLGGRIHLSLSGGLSGSISKSTDIIQQNIGIVPIAPLVYLYGNIGVTMKLSGSIGLETGFDIITPYSLTVSYSSKTPTNLNPGLKFRKPTIEFRPKVVSGSITFGIGGYAELGLAIACRWFGRAAYRYETGLEMGLNASFTKHDIEEMKNGIAIYEHVQNNFNWTITPYSAHSFEVNVFDHIKRTATLQTVYGAPWLEAKFVPSFSNVSYSIGDDTNLVLSADAENNVFPEIPVGFSILDDNKEEVYCGFYTEDYLQALAWKRFNHYEISVPNILALNKKYTLHPVVKLFGNDEWKMLASPSAEISIDIAPIADGSDIFSSRSALLKGHVEGKKEYLGRNVALGFIYGTNSQLESSDSKRVIAQCDSNYNFTATIDDLSGGRTYYYKAFLYGNGKYYYSDNALQFTTPLPVEIPTVTTTTAQYRPTDHPQHFIYKDNPYEFKYDVATVVKLADDEGVENWGYVYEGPYEGDKKSRISLKGAPYEYEDMRFAYYRNGSPTEHTARLYPFVKYTGDDEYYYGEPVDYPLVYPDTSTVELTGCSTGDVVTRENAEYNGVTYDYCSTFILDYNATGAYWITVGAEETGDGWNGWDNNLPAREHARATDGSNRLTINYYYNQKVLKGDYILRIKGSDTQHNTSCTSSRSVRLKHNGKSFTGCELIQ